MENFIYRYDKYEPTKAPGGGFEPNTVMLGSGRTHHYDTTRACPVTIYLGFLRFNEGIRTSLVASRFLFVSEGDKLYL